MTTENILVPTLGESITEAVVAKIHKNKGDSVLADEILFELETDKVTLEVNSPTSGKISSLEVKVGDEVSIGALLASVEAGDVTETKNEESKLWEKQNSLAAKKLINENQIEAENITPTGKSNRITKQDVSNYLSAQEKSSKLAQDNVTKVEKQPENNNTSHDRVSYVKMSKLRQKIAERLKESQNTAAILTTFNEIDMKNVMDLRSKYKEAFLKKHSVKLGFMSFFVKAVISALKEVPEVNAEISKDHIIYKNYYDIGVAVGTEHGLVVPVVRDADQLSISDIEAEISRLGAKARDGKLELSEMQGGTFTISNGGVYGSLLSTPIINPPQSGILGMHSIQQRPVVINGQIEIRPMMYTALSYDHRIVDGKGAVTFLVKLKQYIEDPQRLILEV